MASMALLATRNGSVTAGFEAVVSARGYSVADVLATDRPEDNQYYLPAGVVEELSDRIAESGAEYLAIDGIAHAGQMVDLGTALPTVTIRDRRGVLWERLASGGNPAAETRLALRERRIERRRARRDQRGKSTTGPSGTSGPVSELEQACERHADTLGEQQTTQQQRVRNAYETADTHVTVVGSISAPTTECWEGLTGEQGDVGPLRPATPATALTEIGPHAVAVTDTPGLVAGDSGWLADAIPGTVAAIERADVLVALGGSADIDDLLPTDEFDGAIVRCSRPAETTGNSSERDELDGWTDAVAAEIRAHLSTTRLAVTLPYTDEGHATVSTLHEKAAVETLDYEEDIQMVVEIPDSAVEELRRRIERVDGDWIEQN